MEKKLLNMKKLRRKLLIYFIIQDFSDLIKNSPSEQRKFPVGFFLLKELQLNIYDLWKNDKV